MARPEFKLEDPVGPCEDHPTLPLADRNGKSYCFNCIIASHQSQAYNIACRILNDRFLAEDALQESLTSAYRSFSQFRGDNLRAWLMRIVSNSCRDMLRAQRARPTVPLDPVGPDPDSDDATPLVSNFPTTVESPEDFAERRELGLVIEAGLASLSEERRLSLLLVDVQGFSYEEAASILNCSTGTLKSRISRGRRDLREYLRGAGELLPSRFRQEE